MKKYPEFLLIIFILLFSSCAINKVKQENSQLLQKNLALWQNFEMTGMVQIIWNGLNIYKTINLKNNPHNLQAVLYDSGIFGIKPQPFASIEIADSIVVKSQVLPENIVIDNLSHKEFIPAVNRKQFNEILENKSLNTEKYEIIFNSRFQISGFELKNDFLEINIQYGLDELPSTIKGYNDNRLVFKIDIEKFINL